jgi:hypothetical protein
VGGGSVQPLFGEDGGLRGVARALWVLPAPSAG